MIALPVGKSSDPTTSTAVLDALHMLSDRFISLSMPRFQFSSEYEDDLKEALISIGLMSPFDIDKGFCLMFPDACAVLKVIKQNAFIDVHEKGNKAAAVTFGKFSRSGPRNVILFMEDHPFQLFIYEESERLVIFEGHVGNPRIPIDAQHAHLLAQHSNDTFCSEFFYVVQSSLNLETYIPSDSPQPIHTENPDSPLQIISTTSTPVMSSSHLPTKTPSLSPTKDQVETSRPKISPTDTPVLSPSRLPTRTPSLSPTKGKVKTICSSPLTTTDPKTPPRTATPKSSPYILSVRS